MLITNYLKEKNHLEKEIILNVCINKKNCGRKNIYGRRDNIV